MQDLLDRIRERNFGKTVEFRDYSGAKEEDLGLICAGIEVCSVYINNRDLNVTVYDFNNDRKPEYDEDGNLDDSLELEHIITDIIRFKFDKDGD